MKSESKHDPIICIKLCFLDFCSLYNHLLNLSLLRNDKFRKRNCFWNSGLIVFVLCSVIYPVCIIMCSTVNIAKACLLSLHPAWLYADGAISSRLRPGQCITWIPAIAEQGASLQAKTSGLPWGPAEASSACSKASGQGDKRWTTGFSHHYIWRTHSHCIFTQGSPVQEEMWGTRRAGAGEDLQVWEDEIVGTSGLCYLL